MRNIDRRSFLRCLAGGAAAAAAGRCAPAAAAPASRRKPNIIFVLADDLGWPELGCYGHTFNETPNLDRLAAQGMRFTNAYAAAPVCSPFRASFIAGQWPARIGITDFLRPNDEKFLSPARHFSIAKALKAAGYATGMMGKWHLTGYVKNQGAPHLHGFDEVICSERSGIGGGDYFFPYRFLPHVRTPRLGPNEFLTDRLALEATDFITRHKDGPFFLYVSHYSVHTALAAKKDKVARYARKLGAGKDGKAGKNNPVLAAMLESIDECTGKIMARLDELKLADNTVLIFMSDNGGQAAGRAVTTCSPLRAGKSTLYEGGIREPLIVRWPGVVAPAGVCDEPVVSVDFYPTFLAAAGASGQTKQPLDGVSLMPVLTATGSLKREALYWHYPLERPHFLTGRSAGAIRKGDWKLIEFYDTGTVELYNLADDLGEKTDLAEKMPAKAAELLAKFHAWARSVGAELPKRPKPGLEAHATPSASHCFAGDSVRGMNDLRVPANSRDRSGPKHTWWPHKGTTEWVQYDFDKPRRIGSVEVYWYDDTGRGGIRVPASWKLLYKDGKTWKPVQASGSYGVKRDRFNKMTFKPVTTTALRMQAKLQPKFGGGVLEWRVREAT